MLFWEKQKQWEEEKNKYKTFQRFARLELLSHSSFQLYGIRP